MLKYLLIELEVSVCVCVCVGGGGGGGGGGGEYKLIQLSEHRKQANYGLQNTVICYCMMIVVLVVYTPSQSQRDLQPHLT